MSKKDKRMKQIVEILQREGEVSVKLLSDKLSTSEMTVRRYLDDLEEHGLIKRIHGGAIPVSSFNINERNKYLIGNEVTKNVNLKSAIGFYAAALINDNETIGFDIGTTIPFIAKYISGDKKLSAVCVSFECAYELYHKKNANIILPGGYLDRDSDVFYCEEGISFLSKIRTDKVFISAAGIDKKLGLTCYHNFHVTIKNMLMQSSKRIILVADSTKFGMVSPSHFGDLVNIDTVITDDNISNEYRDVIESLKINLIIAK
jgi:DeoR family deoxyribose operon repressor